MMRVALCPKLCYDDVHLRWTWKTECRPIVAPFVLVQRWIDAAEASRCIGDIRDEDDQVEIMSAVTTQKRAARDRGRGLGYGFTNSARMTRNQRVSLC